MSFFALVTAVSGLPCSSSTMNFTSAPPSLLFFSSRYILKPSTMSLPTWAKTPVVGARKPMRSSSDFAVASRGRAQQPPPSSSGPNRRSNDACHCPHSLVVAVSRLLRRPRVPISSPSPRLLDFGPSLTQALRNAHQPGRQIEDRRHVNDAQHVLPPRHQRAEKFAEAEHDEGADHAADQRARAAQHRHQQRVDRRRSARRSPG